MHSPRRRCLLRLRDVSAEHSNHGHPTFEGLPAFYTSTHQQVHEEWLHRAYQHGLRLMVMMAVDNASMCAVANTCCARIDLPCRPLPHCEAQCSSRAQTQRILAQLEAAHAFAKTHPWYEVVTTPERASAVIREGHLAVILGVESGGLLECGIDRMDSADCRDSSVLLQRLDVLHQAGVRYLFLTHREDSAIAGAAHYDDRVVTLAPCVPDVDGCQNPRGLTPVGKAVLEGAMRRGMLLDLDHMSRAMKEDVIAEARPHLYPLVAGHTVLGDLSRNEWRVESNTSASDLAYIRSSGGIIGLFLRQGNYTGDQAGGPRVVTCGGSSQSFAVAYEHAVEKLGGPVAFGTDFNGFGPMPAPRFGGMSCWPGMFDERGTATYDDPERLKIQAGYAHTRVDYPFFAAISGDQVAPYRMGSREFDVNIDGVAHIGMLPDSLPSSKHRAWTSLLCFARPKPPWRPGNSPMRPRLGRHASGKPSCS